MPIFKAIGSCRPVAVIAVADLLASKLAFEFVQLLRPQSLLAPYLWAVLIALIYKVCSLLCQNCGGQMCLIAFITQSADIR